MVLIFFNPHAPQPLRDFQHEHIYQHKKLTRKAIKVYKKLENTIAILDKYMSGGAFVRSKV